MFSTLTEALNKMIIGRSQIKILLDNYNKHLRFSLTKTECIIKRDKIKNQLTENITALNKLNRTEYTINELDEHIKNISNSYNKYLNKINHKEF